VQRRVNPQTGLIQLEIKGLAERKARSRAHLPRRPEELVTAFVQDKQAMERGCRHGTCSGGTDAGPDGEIIKEKFPNLIEEDQEAVRQHAIAALNIVQQAKKAVGDGVGRTPEHGAVDGYAGTPCRCGNSTST